MISNTLIDQILSINSNQSHNHTVGDIENLFREYGFYTIREYPIYKMQDGSRRAGRIDLVVRKSKFRIAIEYDHYKLIKWKSFQKVVQIRPECAIVITGNGDLEPNVSRALWYISKLKSPLYVVSLKEGKYEIIEPGQKGISIYKGK